MGELSFWSKVFGEPTPTPAYSAKWARELAAGDGGTPATMEDIADILELIRFEASVGKDICMFTCRKVSSEELRLLKELGYRVNASSGSVFVHWSEY